ncbi:MAG: hypothetical protein ACOCZK_01645 [Planctomycetota bacterium]
MFALLCLAFVCSALLASLPQAMALAQWHGALAARWGELLAGLDLRPELAAPGQLLTPAPLAACIALLLLLAEARNPGRGRASPRPLASGWFPCRLRSFLVGDDGKVLSLRLRRADRTSVIAHLFLQDCAAIVWDRETLGWNLLRLTGWLVTAGACAAVPLLRPIAVALAAAGACAFLIALNGRLDFATADGSLLRSRCRRRRAESLIKEVAVTNRHVLRRLELSTWRHHREFYYAPRQVTAGIERTHLPLLSILALALALAAAVPLFDRAPAMVMLPVALAAMVALRLRRYASVALRGGHGYALGRGDAIEQLLGDVRVSKDRVENGTGAWAGTLQREHGDTPPASTSAERMSRIRERTRRHAREQDDSDTDFPWAGEATPVDDGPATRHTARVSTDSHRAVGKQRSSAAHERVGV